MPQAGLEPARPRGQQIMDLRGSRAVDESSIRVDFSPKHFAILRLAIDSVPRTQSGSPIWSKVRRLMLTDVEAIRR